MVWKWSNKTKCYFLSCNNQMLIMAEWHRHSTPYAALCLPALIISPLSDDPIPSRMWSMWESLDSAFNPFFGQYEKVTHPLDTGELAISHSLVISLKESSLVCCIANHLFIPLIIIFFSSSYFCVLFKIVCISIIFSATVVVSHVGSTYAVCAYERAEIIINILEQVLVTLPPRHCHDSIQ